MRKSKNKYKIFVQFFLLILGVVSLIYILHSFFDIRTLSLRSKASREYSPISGTFISFPYSRMETYTRDDWRKQFEVMNNIGIDTLIISGIAIKGYDNQNTLKAFYNSSKYTKGESHLDILLDFAKSYGMSVYVSPLDLKNNWDYPEENIRLSKEIAQELRQLQYTNHPNFSGWYLQEEPFLNMDYNDYSTWKTLVDTYKTLSPKPVAISPYFVTPCYGDQTKIRCKNQWWQDRTAQEIADRAEKLMINIGADIMAVQDGVGASGVTIQELSEYIPPMGERMNKIGKDFWVDAEVFRYNAEKTQFIPAPIADLSVQLDTLNSFKFKTVIWIFDQFMGPYNSNLTHKLYADYITHYKLGNYPPAPFELSIFSDTDSAHWAYPEIKLIYDRKITSGCAANPLKYCPDNPVIRSQASIFILRSMYGGSFIPKVPNSQRFKDVPPDSFAYSWIDNLADLGITSGCGDNNYCPNDQLTRAQAAVMFVKAKKGAAYTPTFSPVFNDVPSSHWASSWISEMYTLGYTQGCGGKNYCPDRPITRAEMAVMLVRVFNIK